MVLLLEGHLLFHYDFNAEVDLVEGDRVLESVEVRYLIEQIYDREGHLVAVDHLLAVLDHHDGEDAQELGQLWVGLYRKTLYLFGLFV